MDNKVGISCMMEKQMYVLVDSEGNIKGRFDHLQEGENLANRLEQNKGYDKLEWAGMRNYNEGYGTNGVNFYRMLEDERRYYIYDRYNKEPRATNFPTLEAAIQHIKTKLVKAGAGTPMNFTELEPGFWYGHNAPSTPAIIKDIPQSFNGGVLPTKYDYFEIKREFMYAGKDKV